MKMGFVGLGNVGSKLAGSLLRNGYDVTVVDLNADLVAGFVAKGAKSAENPAALMRDCDAVITCLPSPAACAVVVEAMLPFVQSGKIWMEMSTTEVSEVKRLAALVSERGGTAIECPVSGGCHRADTGNISIFAGADRETFERMLPILTTLGRRVLHTGEIGTASTLKVMTNYLATANLLTCCEALVTMKAAGIDLNTTYEAMKISSGTSFVHETESQVILNGSRDISFTMDLVKKDIGLFQKLAEDANIPLEISPLMVEIFNDGIARYGARELSPNIIRRLEDATGLDITAPGFPTELTDDEPEEQGYEVIPTGPPNPPLRVDPMSGANRDHWDARADLAASFQWAARLNMHEAVANHFSLAVNDDGTQFLINPNQAHFSRVRASDLLLLDANDPDALAKPNAPDPTAWGLHASIHRLCPHARCVMHTHSIWSTVLAGLADSTLPPIDQNTATFFNRYVVDEAFDGLAFESEGIRCAQMLSDPAKKVMIMGNHGILVVGRSVADTFNRLYYFERAAETYIRALQTGRKLRVMSDETAEKTAAELDDYPGQADAHLKEIRTLLDAQDSDYAS